MSGWPARQSEVSNFVKPYCNFRDELSILNGVVLKGSRTVIPKAMMMRTEVLNEIHDGHLGRSKCKLRACSSVYWPGINAAIDDLVAHYELCQLNQPKNTKEPLISVEILSTLWTKLGIDLCELKKSKHGDDQL